MRETSDNRYRCKWERQMTLAAGVYETSDNRCRCEWVRQMKLDAGVFERQVAIDVGVSGRNKRDWMQVCMRDNRYRC